MSLLDPSLGKNYRVEFTVYRNDEPLHHYTLSTGDFAGSTWNAHTSYSQMISNAHSTTTSEGPQPFVH
jgi:hypothetical protein